MKTLIGLLLGLAATAAWGSFYVAGRWLFGEEGDKLNTYLFNFLRFFMATLSLSGLLLTKSNREKFKQAIKEDWKSFLLISLIGIVMESYLVRSQLYNSIALFTHGEFFAGGDSHSGLFSSWRKNQ